MFVASPGTDRFEITVGDVANVEWWAAEVKKMREGFMSFVGPRWNQEYHLECLGQMTCWLDISFHDPGNVAKSSSHAQEKTSHFQPFVSKASPMHQAENHDMPCYMTSVTSTAPQDLLSVQLDFSQRPLRVLDLPTWPENMKSWSLEGVTSSPEWLIKPILHDGCDC